MKKKIRILRIVSSLDPKYGGPSKTIIDSSKILKKQGFNIDILTSDRISSSFFKSKKLIFLIKVLHLETIALILNYSFGF